VTRRELGFLAATAVVTAIAGVLRYTDASAVAAFAAAALALAGLAWVVALGTEQVAVRSGPAVTGLAQASLGNLPEFFVVIFALSSGELLVAQSSLVGSILANALLVQGLVIVTGAIASEDDLMRFRRRLPQDAATLGMVALSVITLVGVAVSSGGPVSDHVRGLSIVGAVSLSGRLRLLDLGLPALRRRASARARAAPDDPLRGPATDRRRARCRFHL
jgi:calcium/proton exchanger cax